MLQNYRTAIKKWEKWHQDPHDEHGQVAPNPLDEFRKGLCNAEERRLAKEIKKHDRWKTRNLKKMTATQLTKLARRARRYDSPNLASAAILELAYRSKTLSKTLSQTPAATESTKLATEVGDKVQSYEPAN